MTEKQFRKAEAAWDKACESTPRNDDFNIAIDCEGDLIVGEKTYGPDQMRAIYEVLREWYGDAK